MSNEPIMTHDDDDAMFLFCPQNSNPELWRPTLPMVVFDTCRDHRNPIAMVVWMAIKFLIVLDAEYGGQRGLGQREIAEQAGVSRSTVRTSIDFLVTHDLLTIVADAPVSGDSSYGRGQRVVYEIDLYDLEQRSSTQLLAMRQGAHQHVTEDGRDTR
jgi:DNA-binding FadR family transcriptional regulator